MTGDDELATIDLTGGVNEAGDAFVTIVVHTTSRRMLLGQLTPTDVRRMALQWLESAEAAEQDAAVLRCVRNLGLPDDLAGAVVIELRNSRAD